MEPLTRANLAWLADFRPHRLLRNGHAQTLAGNYWRRRPFQLKSESQAVLVDESDGSRVLCHCHWQPESIRASHLTILLVHGLEGSSESRYMRGIAQYAFEAGCNVIRMNMRNCGGTEDWTPTLYHSGLSSDVYTVLRFFVTRHGLQRVAMAGYSMGGNLVLKLAGELAGDAPPWLTAAVAVSPAMDLAPSADALHEPANRAYEWHFLRNLMNRYRRKAALFPDRYAAEPPEAIRSIREFDDRITAPHSGFTSADDYYDRASSARVASSIRIPSLILHALDDPFIRMLPATRQALLLNPATHLIETAHGGHCAFLAAVPQAKSGAAREGNLSRHWAETTLVQFLLSVPANAASPQSILDKTHQDKAHSHGS